MLVLVNSRVCPGVSRDQVIDHFTSGVERRTWDLIRRGVIVHWFFKVGDHPGVIAVLNCDSVEEARAVVGRAPVVTKGLVTFEFEPIDHFPNFPDQTR